MPVVRLVSALVAGAALCLGPAATAGASELRTRGTDISVTAAVPGIMVVNSLASDTNHQDKSPKPPKPSKPPKPPKPNHGKHQQPLPVPAPPPMPAPPPLPVPVPVPRPQPPTSVNALTVSPVVANGAALGVTAGAQAGGDRAGAVAVAQRPGRALASDVRAELSAATVANPLVEPALAPPFQLGDISLWAYGAVFLIFALLGLGAWVLHLRGARW